MSQLLSSCLECGAPCEGVRCPEHRIPASARPPRQRDDAYRTYSWQKLSQRARKLQPFCSDCGTTEDLQCDHLPIAWERYEKGLPVRLQDVDVVCGECNRKRGAARGENITHKIPGGEGEKKSALWPPWQAKSQLLQVSTTCVKEVDD